MFLAASRVGPISSRGAFGVASSPLPGWSIRFAERFCEFSLVGQVLSYAPDTVPATSEANRRMDRQFPRGYSGACRATNTQQVAALCPTGWHSLLLS